MPPTGGEPHLRARTWYRACVVGSLAVFLLLGPLWVLLPRTGLLRRAAGAVERSLTAVVKGPVSVGSVQVTASGKILLRDVRLAISSAEAEMSASAEAIAVNLSLWRLLRKHEAASAILSVSVSSPRLELAGTESALSDLMGMGSGAAVVAAGLPFSLRLENLSVGWQGYSWQEQCLSIVPEGESGLSARVAVKRGMLEAANLPFPIEMSGTGTVLWTTGVQGLVLRLFTPAGTVTGRGVVSWGSDDGWNVVLEGKRLRLADRYLSEPFDVAARVTGPWLFPRLELQAGRVRGRGWRADSMMAALDLRERTLKVDSLQVARGAAQMRASGNLLFSDEPRLDFRVEGSGIAESDLEAIGLSLPLKGTGAFSGRLHGPVDDLQLDAALEIREGRLFRTPFAELRASVKVDAGQVAVTDGSATIPDSGLEGYRFSGTYELPSRYLRAAVTAAGLSAADALAWPNLTWPWEGKVGGKVSIEGPLDRLSYDIALAASEGKAWGLPYRDLSANLSFAGGVTTIRTGSLRTAGGTLSVDGRVQGESVALCFRPSGVSLSELVRIGSQWAKTYAPQAVSTMQFLERWVPSGAANAAIEVEGSSKAPQIAASFVVPKLSLGGMTAGHWRGEVSSSGKGLQLRQLAIALGDGTASLQGSMVPGDVYLKGRWADMPAALVSVFMDLPEPLTGLVTGEVELFAGKRGSGGTLAWKGYDLALAGSKVTDAGGTVKVQGGQLRLDGWRGSMAGRTVEMHGFVPMPKELARLLGVQASQAMDLTVVVPRGPLAPLVAWLPLFPAARGAAGILLNGGASGEAHVHIGGTLKAPQMQGQARITGGSIALPQPWGNVTHIDANITFGGPTVRLVRGSARGLGGRFAAEGELTWRAGVPMLNGRLNGHASPRTPGLGGEADLDLSIDGTLSDPRIIGEVTLRRGEIDLTGLKLGGSGLKTPINPRLDISLALKQLRVKAGSLFDMSSGGTLKLSGRLQKPALSGQLLSDRGRLNYLGTNFAVEEATASFSNINGALPQVSLWGTTWIGRTAIALRLSGVGSDITVRLASEPPLSQREILALLDWPGRIERINSGSGEMAEGLMEVLQGGIEMRLVNGLEAALRQGLGLDEFHLEPNLGERRVRLSAGKYLLPRIYVTYEQSLFSKPEGDLNMEYRLDNGWKLSAGLGDGGEVRVGVGGKIRF